MQRIVAGLVISTALMSACLADEPAIAVKEIGSFFVGGRSVTLKAAMERPRVVSAGAPAEAVNPNGDFETGQIYVRFVRLAQPVVKYPLLLWHGGGLTGVSYESTPDGRAGWDMSFMRAGYDVFVSDSVMAGRSSWNRYPEMTPSEPLFRTKEALWNLFRIGPAGSYATNPQDRKPYSDQRFPAARFDEFVKQVVPRFTTTDPATQQAYDELLVKICPCIVLTHSAAGPFGFASALKRPDLVKALISVEPSGGPDPKEVDVLKLRNVPLLFVWGDHLDLENTEGLWSKLYSSTKRFSDSVVAVGGNSTWTKLTDAGFRGNSHLIMMDSNSGNVAALVQDWIRQQKLDR